MLKVRLLTDGGYESMQAVTIGSIFPAKFATANGRLVAIERDDLIKAGANGEFFSGRQLTFFVGSEVEILD